MCKFSFSSPKNRNYNKASTLADDKQKSVNVVSNLIQQFDFLVAKTIPSLYAVYLIT